MAEQELRYQEFKRVGVENINEYNQLFSNCPIPRIVSVTDECFDLLSDTTYKDSMEMVMLMKAAYGRLFLAKERFTITFCPL